MRKLLSGLLAAVWLFTLVSCGGSGSGRLNLPGSAPLVLTVGDAPLSGVLAAKITLSEVDLLTASGSTAVLMQPKTIELTSLAGIQEPLDLGSVPAGTYTGVKVTVSAAQITYIDPTTKLPVEQSATVANNGTATVQFASPLTVSATSALDLHLDFDLAHSLDLTYSTLTFTPTLKAAAASVEDEPEERRHVHAFGTVTAVNTSSTPNTVTIETLVSHSSLTFTVNSSTAFAGGLTLSSLQTGEVVAIKGKVQPDGSLLATRIAVLAQSEPTGTGGQGLVLIVSKDSSGNLTSFLMVMRGSFEPGEDEVGLLKVNVDSSTQFVLTDAAKNAGMTTFDATQIFPGQSVSVTGTGVSAGVIAATQISPAQVGIEGLLAAAPQGTAPNFTFSLMPAGLLNELALLAHMPIAVNVSTSSNTAFDGTLTQSSFGSLQTGTRLGVLGFVQNTSNGATVLATDVRNFTED